MVIAGFIFPGVQVPSAWGGARSISKSIEHEKHRKLRITFWFL